MAVVASVILLAGARGTPARPTAAVSPAAAPVSPAATATPAVSLPPAASALPSASTSVTVTPIPMEPPPDVLAAPLRTAPPNPLTVAEVQAFLDAQVRGISAGSAAFAATFDDTARVFLPHVLNLITGRSAIQQAVEDTWLAGRTLTVTSNLSAIGLSFGGTLAWVTTTWRNTDGPYERGFDVRVTEVVVRRGPALRAVAASFSIAPSRGGFSAAPPPRGLPPVTTSDGADAWLGNPAALARNLFDEPATSLIGSDANEVAIGPSPAQRLLRSWGALKLDLLGPSVIEDIDRHEIVLALVRSRGARPAVYRTLALFAPHGGEEGSPLAAVVHYSVPVVEIGAGR